MKNDMYVVKQTKRQLNYQKKKDKENDRKTKDNVPYS